MSEVIVQWKSEKTLIPRAGCSQVWLLKACVDHNRCGKILLQKASVDYNCCFALGGVKYSKLCRTNT